MKPLLIYDGDCGFCRRWIARWRAWTGDRVDYAAYQDTAKRYPQISRSLFENAVHLVEADGKVSRGAEAVFRALAYVPGRRWLLGLYERIPWFKALSERVYRFVASHRVAFSRLTTLLWGDHLAPSTYFLARWLFLRTLGVVYLVAFISLWTQLSGLIGSGGILPAASYLDAIAKNLGPERFWALPSLAWITSADWFLHAMCAGGTLLAALLVLGIAPALSAFGLWVLYLSLATISREFLGYQWDILLLETGLLAVFLAPSGLRPKLAQEAAPDGVMVLLMHWLLFRLMFSSGVVKLMSGDATWRDLTALNFHYQTQPLPTRIAWYAQQLPESFQKFSVALMFAIELAVPFLIALPRRAKFAALLPLLMLQSLILVTGNYCFFNWLALALCLFLLDDEYLRKLCPKGLVRRIQGALERPAEARARRYAARGFAALALFVGAAQLYGLFEGRRGIPAFAADVQQLVEPFRSINRYGLFAVMTTSRPEIIVEGSDDGAEWRPYEFKWKPGDLKAAPGFVAPHQPRLDWQMWFAALGTYENNSWFQNFLARLLQGSPEVLGLLAVNPFPDKPPRFVRAQLYEYRFTDSLEKSADGSWWKRVPKGVYSPAATLRE